VEATWNSQFELDLESDARRRVRRAYAFSAAGHLVIFALLMLRPAPDPILLPAAITVDLVAAVPRQAPPAAARKAEAPPAPKPVPVAPPPPPQARILPKRAPDAMAKPVTPKSVEPIRRRPRPKEMELGDAMAALRSELGEQAASPLAAPETTRAPTAAPADSTGSGGVRVSPERLAWINATKRHIQSVWVNPPEFLDRGLRTDLRVELLADGTIVGEPEVLRSSGDPYADDNAVRALLKSSPLPAPPKPGPQTFIFTPEAPPR
jgi:outer membrane biosynthesis protein TonB